MNEDDRDRELQAWFAGADEDLPAEPFTAAVLAALAVRARRNRRLQRILVLGILAVAALVVYSQLAAFGSLSRLVTGELVELGHGILPALIAPVNHLGLLLAVALLVGYRFCRRIFT